LVVARRFDSNLSAIAEGAVQPSVGQVNRDSTFSTSRDSPSGRSCYRDLHVGPNPTSGIVAPLVPEANWRQNAARLAEAPIEVARPGNRRLARDSLKQGAYDQAKAECAESAFPALPERFSIHHRESHVSTPILIPALETLCRFISRGVKSISGLKFPGQLAK
jgi:hypothetical protein